MSIRLRLTLWYTAILFVALAAFAVVLGQQIMQTRYRDLDVTLSGRAREAGAEVDVLVNLNASVVVADVFFPSQERFDRLAQDEVSVQFFDPRGIGRQRSSNREEYFSINPADLAALRRGDTRFRDYSGENGDVLRVYLYPLRVREQFYGVIVTAQSVTPITTSLKQTLLGLAAGTLGVSLLLALIVYAVAKNALRPITRMARDAAGIQKAQDLAGRVAVPKTGDEVAALGRTINEMLGRLEVAFESQRRFIADASHELRTPLTAIRGNADILRQHADRMGAADRAETLDEVSAEAERMSRLVNDLLTLARAQAGEIAEPHPVRLDEATDSAVRAARGLARGHEITYASADGVPLWVRGDADRLKQVLLILLDNAVKYTPPEGHIWVWLSSAGAQVELRVADDGPGIPAEQLPHLFERFYRGGSLARGRDDGGAGLGLAIAREIVAGFGGTISAESSVGHGTAFIVRLPRIAPPADADEIASPATANTANEAVAAG